MRIERTQPATSPKKEINSPTPVLVRPGLHALLPVDELPGQDPDTVDPIPFATRFTNCHKGLMQQEITDLLRLRLLFVFLLLSLD